MNQKFYKYHGAGNDFVLMDARDRELRLSRNQIRTLCNRCFAIGADGFMMLENDPAGTEFYMRYFNSDGGEVAMCGNGGRCISLFAHHLGIGGEEKVFNSLDGLHVARMTELSGNCGRIRLKMIDVEGCERQSGYLFMNTGVPHYIEFVPDVEQVDLVNLGRRIRYAEPYASQGGTNVNIVQLLPDGTLRIRTYERGVEGETYACGTGATAAAIAASIEYFPERNDFLVHTAGGPLRITFEKTGEGAFREVYLEGPAVKVFECELNLDEILPAV
ncbi:MAG: diaminopimelate epimerase [Rikenellaceae bacterium]|nr:diaminopimelate epimerase [Rikenellaceae bacterium]